MMMDSVRNILHFLKFLLFKALCFENVIFVCKVNCEYTHLPCLIIKTIIAETETLLEHSGWKQKCITDGMNMRVMIINVG